MHRIVFLLFIVIALVYGFLLIQGKKLPGNIGSQSETTVLAVKKETIKEDNKAKRYIIDVEYPQINGFSSSEKEKIVNQKIKEAFANEITVFTAESSLPIPSMIPSSIQSGYTLRYEVVQASNAVVSIDFNVSNFAAGSAHPANYTIPFNYDVVSGKELILSDLFKKNSSYLAILSDYAKKDLQEQDNKNRNDFSSFIATGTQPAQENFQKFVLAKDWFVLLFDPGLVSPYAAGIRKVEIPFAKLREQLNSNLSFLQ